MRKWVLGLIAEDCQLSSVLNIFDSRQAELEADLWKQIPFTFCAVSKVLCFSVEEAHTNCTFHSQPCLAAT